MSLRSLIITLLVACGCAQRPHAAGPAAQTVVRDGAATTSIAPTVPTRPLRFDAASMQFPAHLAEPKQEGTYLYSEGTADQIDPSITNGQSIVVGVNVYASPADDFGRRPDARDWATHPMPPNSAFRRATIVPARAEAVKVAGASDAAISVSVHDGHEPFGTDGQRALSIRLFVRDPKNDGSGWVIGAYAYGSASEPALTMDSKLASELEAIVRTFRLTVGPASER